MERKKERGGVKCFVCEAGPLKRPIHRIPMLFPAGTRSYVPICRDCARKVRAIQVQVKKNPHMQVTYKIIL